MRGKFEPSSNGDEHHDTHVLKYLKVVEHLHGHAIPRVSFENSKGSSDGDDPNDNSRSF